MMIDRNTAQSKEVDINHLKSILKNIDKLDTSSSDRATIEYLRQQITDWIEELEI